MRLTKLEIHGFKAFADHTEFVFERGVTTIVGPNGCGKSNVSDAVRWVLGEQRARVMRGAKMEDVIFHGSSARRAVNMAEVSLHFDNEDGDLPVAFKEVVITRRLMRSGESEYRLNRSACRLRDIQDLVRGTGLGAESGVVIESKMIDALLSDRPDDRRELFEEAAGVGLYRDRRRSAERRLEETTVDLSRLDDLISEVQSQVRSLSRQRRRAERHAELTSRRFNVELSLATREMASWQGELADLDGRLVQLRESLPKAEAEIRDAESAREQAHGARIAAEANRSELARLATDQRQKTQQLERELAVAEERQRNTLMRRQRAEEERKEGEAFGRRLREDRERAATDRTTLTRELEEAGEALQQRVITENASREDVQKVRAAVELLERQVREHRDKWRRLELDREGAGRERNETDQRQQALEHERQQLADVLSNTERELAVAQEHLSLANSNAQEAQLEVEGARVATSAARTADAEARGALARVVEERTGLQGKVNALEGLERERVGLAPSAAKLLKEKDRFGDGAVLGPLTDFVSADGEAARMVERYLGATLHAIVVRDTQAADLVRVWHAQTHPGPLLLLPLDVVAELDAQDAGALATSVQSTGPAERWVRALLGKVRALDNGEAFVDERGAIFLPGTTAGPGPLQRRAELTRLRQDLEAADATRDAAAAAAEQARGELTEAERVQHAAVESSNRAQQEARRADELAREAGRKRERADREVQASNALAERLTMRFTELDTRMQQLAAQLESMQTQTDETDSTIAATRAELSETEKALELAREGRSTWQVAQAQAQARLSVAVDRERRLLEEDSTAALRLEALASELTTLADADTHLTDQLSAWQTALDTEQKSRDDADARLATSESELREASETLTVTERVLDDARRALTAIGEQLHAAELRHTDLSGRREAIRQRLETEWRRTLEDLLANFESLELETDALRDEAVALRTALDELGPVNPLAIEEHEEEQRRLEFLTGQRNDLVAAKSSLHQAMREIDSTARELFLAMFAQVRQNFREIFLTLFGGGECDLRLENPDAPLDCDIEVHASPRGKKTQRIHLLSSGERALVALSLLFGIFLTKPSPFCLMDEVDAPLDDQNIGRFVQLLNKFKHGTQFIVITHNPRTTAEAADSTYGVTMQEPGVSKIVAVRMRAPNAVTESPDEVIAPDPDNVEADAADAAASNAAAAEAAAEDAAEAAAADDVTASDIASDLDEAETVEGSADAEAARS
ncbi:MAG: chromosome segregation protein SMC [Phycisphaerae bacterium]|nr:chromosome segregation protein SMC [Gemmatimonadaceae bacterium]